jgi:hypothetical protein
MNVWMGISIILACLEVVTILVAHWMIDEEKKNKE